MWTFCRDRYNEVIVHVNSSCRWRLELGCRFRVFQLLHDILSTSQDLCLGRGVGRELGCGFIKERAKEGVKKKASEFLRERERERGVPGAEEHRRWRLLLFRSFITTNQNVLEPPFVASSLVSFLLQTFGALSRTDWCRFAAAWRVHGLYRSYHVSPFPLRGEGRVSFSLLFLFLKWIF